MPAFEGFRSIDHEGEVRIRAVVGGDGPPLLLLHGYPQTHRMWHHLAPELARTHTVVAADLRGYGASGKPVDSADHATYSKRTTAADQVGLMRSLGFDTFAVVGHDRGARVTHRMLLDHPGSVHRAAVLDIVPTHHAYAHVDRELAEAYDHWFFLTGAAPQPEHLIGLDPAFWVRAKLAQWSRSGIDRFDPAAVQEYVDAFSDPACIAATTADYRAGASIDLVHDEADRTAGRRVQAPLLVLWGRDGFVGNRYDVLDVWRAYADDVSGTAVPGGHFLPEESPAETLIPLQAFLG
ncbi:alpha/beta fold hydrolase [Jatrophihabitans sp. YIM 134969]